MSEIQRIKSIYYLISFLGFQLYMAPVLVLFYLNHVGLSFKNFTIFETFIFVAITLLEIPSGAISDLIGKKKAIVMSNLIIVTGMLLLVFYPSLTTIIIAAILFPTGVAINSGNLQAIIFENLKKNNEEATFLEISSKGQSISFAMTVFAALIGGYLASIDIRIPVILDSLCILGSTLAISILLKTHSQPNTTIGIDLIKKGYGNIIQSIKEVGGNLHLLTIIGLASTIFAYTRSSYMIYQPTLESFEFTKTEIGIFFSFFGIISAIFSYLNKKINVYFSKSRHMEFLFLFLVSIATLIAFFNNQHAFIAVILIQQIIRGLSPAFFATSINGLIKKDNNRVTIISIANFMNSLLCSLSILWVGFLSERFNYQLALFAFSLTAMIFLALLALLNREK